MELNEDIQDNAAFMDCAADCTAHLNQLHARAVPELTGPRARKQWTCEQF